MTNKERLISLLGYAPPSESVEGALLDEGLVSSDVYSAANLLQVKKAVLGILRILLSTADTQTGTAETGFGVRYDRSAIEKRIESLEDELGITIGKPRITGISPW